MRWRDRLPSMMLAVLLAMTWQCGAAESPRLVVQTGQDSIRVAAWSPDGRLLASGAGDGRVLLWDAASGRQLEVLTGPPLASTTTPRSAGAGSSLKFSSTGGSPFVSDF